MVAKINPIVAKTSPNLYAAAQSANLPQEQINQLEQFSWTVDKNKKLNQLNVDQARKEFSNLEPEVQDKLRYLFPKAEYAQAPDTFGDKVWGATKSTLGSLANPLVAVFKLAGVWNRAINLPYLMSRQAAQGEGFFNKQTFTDAWDGRRVFDNGALKKASDYFGSSRVEVAKGLLAGKTPGEIIMSNGGKVNQELLTAIEEAYNDPSTFKQVLDGVKYAQVSPGRDIARAFFAKDPSTISFGEDYVDSQTKNVSGVVDFFYQIAVDPLTWATAGTATLARKIPGVARVIGPNKFGSQMRATIEKYGAAGVKQIFDDKTNGVAKLWDDQLGPRIKQLNEAPTVADKSKIIQSIKEDFPAYHSDESILMLANEKIHTADDAVRFFSQVEKVPLFLSGRIDGVQYFRNGVATASAHRRLGMYVASKLDDMFNPATFKTSQEIEAVGDNFISAALRSTPENGNVAKEVEDINKFHSSLGLLGKFRSKVSRGAAESPQGRVILLGDKAPKTAKNFYLTARQVMPKDMANFVTQRFIASPVNEQISLMKAIDYAIIERFGIVGQPGGKKLAQEIITTKYGINTVTGSTADMAIKPEIAKFLGKDSVVEKDGLTYLKAGSIVQPFQETKALSSLDYYNLSEVAYKLNSKKNIMLALGGAVQSKTASEIVNLWSKLTLIPRLGIRSAVDEGIFYLLTAPARNIFDLLARKGHLAGDMSAAYTGSKSGERIRQKIARSLGYKSHIDTFDIVKRQELIAAKAKELDITVEELSSSTRNMAQALGVVDHFSDVILNRLDDEDLRHFTEILAYVNQYLHSATRSIVASTNAGGRQAEDVTEQLLSQDALARAIRGINEKFAVELKQARKTKISVPGTKLAVEVEGKGRAIEADDADLLAALNGRAINLIHFENFIKRFYGNNVKNIEGEAGVAIKGGYRYNPAKVFLENNALKTESDWLAARDAMLRTIGIKPKTSNKYAEVGLPGETVSIKHTHEVFDKTAINSFLSDRVDAAYLQQDGKDIVEIANLLVMQSLNDLYRYFHGDITKYNDELYTAFLRNYHLISNGIDPKTADLSKVPENLNVDFKGLGKHWSAAIKAIDYDKFYDLTKEFVPTGTLYTKLSIEGLDDMETAYTKLGNNWLEVMDAQVTGIIRQPAVMITMLKLRKAYSVLEKQHTNQLVQEEVLRLKEKGVSVSEERLEVIRKRMKLQSAKFWSEIAVEQASDEILKFVDNPTIRSNFSVASRNVGRYYRATEDFWRRVMRMGDKEVRFRVLYRMRLAHVGLSAAGGIYKDQNGDQYVMMPMDDILFKTVQGTYGILHQNETVFKQPMFNDFTLKLKLANPSFTPDAGLPTLSGPVAGLSVLGMKAILGKVGLNKQAEELDNIALGSIGDNIDVYRAIIPSTVQKLWAMLPKDEKDRQESTAAMQAIAYNASQGYMLDPNATPAEKAEYLKNIRISAHNVLVIRSILGLMSPLTPTMQESKGVPDYLKEVGITGLRPEFFDILNAVTKKYQGDIQDPYELAVATFIGKNRGKLIYNVSRNEKTTNVIINKTKQLKDWAINNKDNIQTYGEAAFIFAPNTGDFDTASYTWLEASGLIQNKDLETYFRDIVVSKDKQTYYDIAKEEKEFLAKTLDVNARKAKVSESTYQRNLLKASNPLLEAAITGGGNEVGTELNMLNSIEQILVDGRIKIDNGSKQRMAMVTSRIREFVSVALDPEMRNLENFSDIKRSIRYDIELLINDLSVSDPILKEANRAVFRSILEYYSRDTYTAKVK